MNIICRPYLYKVITPSNKSRMITKWIDNQPVIEFEAFDKVKVALSVRDVEIENTYHEITRNRAEKLLKEKAKLLNPVAEVTPAEETNEEME